MPDLTYHVSEHAMNLPSKADMDVYGSPDELSACDHFLGKTIEQAEVMFRESGEYYQEDLMWMGPVGFSFYLRAAINYLQSEAAVGDDHLIDCLHNVVMFRMEQDGFALAIKGVKQVVDYVIANYQKFQVNEDIYGDVLEKYNSLSCRLGDIK